MTLSNQIQARIRAFTVELEQLVHAAAIEAVQGAFASGRAKPVRGPLGDSFATEAPRPARGRPARKGGKRDPKLIEALVTRVGTYVEGHEGQGVEAIAKALNVRTHDITLPIKKLLAAKTIKSRGQKRGTKYFAG